MLRTTCLISRGILPVCIAFDDEGCIEALACYVRSCTCVADHLVIVFNVMQPPPAIEPCNREASEDKLRLSKLSLLSSSLHGLCSSRRESQLTHSPLSSLHSIQSLYSLSSVQSSLFPSSKVSFLSNVSTNASISPTITSFLLILSLIAAAFCRPAQLNTSYRHIADWPDT